MIKSTIAVCVVSLSLHASYASANEFDYLITEQGREKIATELALYKRQKITVADLEYSASGAYLDYRLGMYSESERVKFDQAGLPMVKSGTEFYYNPVTLGQFALSAHADNAEIFLKVADKLVELQDVDGAFRYYFAFRHYTNSANYAPGWVSGMAQGVILSALSRAYLISNDERYLDAGKKAFDFLQVKHPHGPMTDLGYLKVEWSDKIFFQEYLTEPHVYTLNGYMFTLLGIYDWANVTKSEDAKILFEKGFDTLLTILPFYDMGNFSAYDLSFITHRGQPVYLDTRTPHVAARYHKVHIQLLNALRHITKNDTIAQFEAKWRAQVD